MDTPSPDARDLLAELASTHTWFHAGYDVRTGIDGTTVHSAQLLVGVLDSQRAPDAVVSWAHAHDTYADPRIDASVRIADLDVVDAGDILDRLCDLVDAHPHLLGTLTGDNGAVPDALIVAGLDDAAPTVNAGTSTD